MGFWNRLLGRLWRKRAGTPQELEELFSAVATGRLDKRLSFNRRSVRELLALGFEIDVPVPDCWNTYVVDQSVGMGDSALPITKLLVEHGADLHRIYKGRTLLQKILAPAYTGNKATIDYLRSMGVPESSTEAGRTGIGRKDAAATPKEQAEIVATMPADDAKNVAKLTARQTGLPVSELDMSGLLLGAQLGHRDHITLLPGGQAAITDSGRAALKGLTVWIDTISLYVVRGKIAPSSSARYLGTPPEGFFAQSVKKYHHS